MEDTNIGSLFTQFLTKTENTLFDQNNLFVYSKDLYSEELYFQYFGVMLSDLTSLFCHWELSHREE